MKTEEEILTCDRCGSEKLTSLFTGSFLFTSFRIFSLSCQDCGNTFDINYYSDVDNCLICGKHLPFGGMLCRAHHTDKTKDITSSEIASAWFDLRWIDRIQDITWEMVYNKAINSLQYKERMLREIQKVNTSLKKTANE